MPLMFVCRSASHAGDGVLHGNDAAHDPRGDVLCVTRPLSREPAPLPAGYPCTGNALTNFGIAFTLLCPCF